MIPIITGFLSKINKKIIIAVIMVFLIVSIFIVLIAAKDSEIHKKRKRECTVSGRY
ncbi:hypothetical protein OFQ50_04595 [Brachyspira hyodysenteriae]|nr:hypothetical protein [Brachyspira hyodysenteriae]MCZ9991898.1 hypothetical protein [Brachyspira hyodysenteriae]